MSKIRLTDSSERIKVKNYNTGSLSKGVSMEKIMQIAGDDNTRSLSKGVSMEKIMQIAG